MKDFIANLQSEMYAQLEQVKRNEFNVLQLLSKRINIISETISQLKSYILHYTFVSKEEEIEFFKNYEPILYSELLLYKRLLELEINRPVSIEDKKKYYSRELKQINNFLDRKRFWVVYYRTRATYLDEKYFLRNGSIDDPASSNFILTSDTRFCTVGSINFSRIRCNEMLTREIEKRLASLTSKDGTVENEPEKKFKQLKWKGPKVGLVEFGYACKEAGVFDESLQEIFECFELFFGIRVENAPRTFQEILSRKKEEAIYLDKLTLKLKERRDRMNQNFKSKK